MIVIIRNAGLCALAWLLCGPLMALLAAGGLPVGARPRVGRVREVNEGQRQVPVRSVPEES